MENILAKKVTGEASSSELAILDQWRKESEENQRVYDEYAMLWNMSANYEPESFNPNFEEALASHLDIIKEVEEQEETPEEAVVKTIAPKTTTKLFSIKRFSSIAAIFVLGIAAVFLLNNNTTSIEAANGVQFATLEDGSSVWLNEGASIEYEKGFGLDHRNVSLKGKAFFDVNRNENLPFHIVEGDINVTVLGTSFTVDGDNNIVSVTTGKVVVDHDTEKVILVKDQEATLENDRFNTSNSNTNTALWRNEFLSFDNSPIAQVIADINMYHNDKVVLDYNSDLADCTFTSGGLSSESLENIIEILRKSFDLNVATENDGKIKLSIINCN